MFSCYHYSLGSTDKKREAPPSQLASSSQISAKKSKPGLTNPGAFTALGRPVLKIVDPPSPSSGGNRLEPWEEAAIEVKLCLPFFFDMRKNVFVLKIAG